MDAGLRPREATNLPASEGRTHMFYTGTPLFAFGFGLSCESVLQIIPIGYILSY